MNIQTKMQLPITTEPEPAELPDQEINWRDAAVCIEEQPRTAVYLNPRDQVVIRQMAWPDEDPFVVIGLEHLPALIRELQSYLP